MNIRRTYINNNGWFGLVLKNEDYVYICEIWIEYMYIKKNK